MLPSPITLNVPAGPLNRRRRHTIALGSVSTFSRTLTNWLSRSWKLPWEIQTSASACSGRIDLVVDAFQVPVSITVVPSRRQACPGAVDPHDLLLRRAELHVGCSWVRRRPVASDVDDVAIVDLAQAGAARYRRGLGIAARSRIVDAA
jgi:hypothetical protein